MGLAAFNKIRREQAKKKDVEIDYEEMRKTEIMELLDEKGIEYSDRDNKSTLIELLKKV